MMHRRRRRPTLAVIGWPEAVILLTAALVLLPAVLWMRYDGRRDWRQTTGFARSAVIESTHYNAAEYGVKVTVEFDYAVDGMPYRDSWTGFWPAAGGPNALAPADLDRLTRNGHPLAVFYDPESPWSNYLHPDTELKGVLFAVWIAGALGLFLLYCVRVYPRLRA